MLILQHRVGMPGAFERLDGSGPLAKFGRQNLPDAAESSWCSLDLAISMMCEFWRGRKHHRLEARRLQGLFPSFAGEDGL